MAVKCQLCGKSFRNKQALRGHAWACQKRPATAQPGSAAAQEPIIGSVADEMVNELKAERARLASRRIGEAHRRLDEEEQERAQRKEEARERTRLERQAEREAEERAEREAQRQARRRELIQDGKKRVESSWVRGRAIPSPVKARALRAVEEELAGLARLEALPAQEIRELAQGAWDGVVLPWVQTLEAQEERERRRQREADETKQRLLARGKRYAEGRLDAEGIQGLDRLVILPKVEAALTRELTGAETGRDVEGLVEEVLAPEIQRVRHEAEERRRREAERERQRREQEEERKRQEVEWARQRRERERERQERAEEARLAANRQRLVRHGESYALRTLNEENELEPLERFRLAREVKEQLLDELEGDEDEAEVEDLAEEILAEELD